MQNSLGDFLVNTEIEGSQTHPRITGLQNGSFVALWRHGSGLKAKIFDSGGELFRDEFLVVAGTEVRPSSPLITDLQDGGFAVSWVEIRGVSGGAGSTVIKVMVYDALGAFIRDELAVISETENFPTAHTITGLVNGDFLVSWLEYSETPNISLIRAKIFDVEGAITTEPPVIEIHSAEHLRNYKISYLQNGGFAVTWWEFSDFDNSSVKAKIYDSKGIEVRGEFRINTDNDDYQINPRITGLKDGGFVISWIDQKLSADRSSTTQTIKAKVFNSDGLVVQDEFIVSFDRGTPFVTSLSTGGFVVSWEFSSQIAYNEAEHKAKIFDANGSVVRDEFFILPTTELGNGFPTIAGLKNGGFVVSWSDENGNLGDDDGSSVNAKIFDYLGNVVLHFPKAAPDSMVLEYFTRIVSYKGNTEGYMPGDELLDVNGDTTGYIIDQIFTTPSGFLAVAAVSATHEPILAIRGSEITVPVLDFLFADTDPDGVGVGQFGDAWRQTGSGTLRDWVATHQDVGIHLVGHSLAGAQAQLLAVAATENGHQIASLTTYNSAGIPDSWLARLNASLLGEVEHRISAGDIVSMAGDGFIEGEVNIYNNQTIFGDSILSIIDHIYLAHASHYSQPELYSSVYDIDHLTNRSDSLAPAGPIEVSTLSDGSYSHATSNGFVDPDYTLMVFGLSYLIERVGPRLDLLLGQNVVTFGGEDVAVALSSRDNLEELRKGFGSSLREGIGAVLDFVGNLGPDLLSLAIDLRAEIKEVGVTTLAFGRALAEWGIDAVAGLRNWGEHTWDTFLNWSGETLSGIVDWSVATVEGFANWSMDTVAGAVGWRTETLSGLAQWKANTWHAVENWDDISLRGIATWGLESFVEIADWGADSVAALGQWRADTWAASASWGARTWSGLRDWTADSISGLAEYSAETLKGLAHWSADLFGRVADFGLEAISVSIQALESVSQKAVEAGQAVYDTFLNLGGAISRLALPDNPTVEEIEALLGVPEEKAGSGAFQGTDAREDIQMSLLNDEVAPGLGFDVITFGAGSDTARGTAAELDGDRFRDFTVEDRILFEGTGTFNGSIDVTYGSALLDIDFDGDEVIDSTVYLEGDFEGAQFSAEVENGTTTIRVYGASNGIIELGTDGDDQILGSPGEDRISGGGGNDILYGDGLKAAYVASLSAQVYRLYQATLDREPDAGGHLNWTTRLFEEARTLTDVAQGFVGSPEFQATYGQLDDAGFVGLLYNNVLGRDADAGGLAHWTGDLASGASRADVVLGLSQSAEFIAGTRAAANAFTQSHTDSVWGDDVYRLYRATLDREPDLAGYQNWSGRLGDGADFDTVVTGFVRSPEFQATYGELDDVGFVGLLYNNVLVRDADAGGLAHWTGDLASGATREAVVRGFSQSPEFIAATAAPLETWIRAQGTDDVLDGGAGDNTLMGGMLSDVFVFDATQGGSHRVMDLEAWDTLDFRGFGYSTASDARANMTSVGADVVFADQGLSATFFNTDLAIIDDNMIL